MGIVAGCVGFRVQDSGPKFEATGVGLGFGVNADMFRGLGSGFHGLSLGDRTPPTRGQTFELTLAATNINVQKGPNENHCPCEGRLYTY